MPQLLLEDFLKTRRNNAPVCREERQYAALLYMAFVAVRNNCANSLERDIVRRCLELKENVELNVLEVYFEATLMRDLRYKFKDVKDPSFDNALDTFCEQLCKQHASSNHRRIAPNKLRSHLLHTKPDMAVLYQINGITYLSMIECKYLSRVNKYNGYSQIELQELICRFLCDFFSEKKNRKYTSAGAKLIRLYYQGETKPNEESVGIKIQELFDLYYSQPK